MRLSYVIITWNRRERLLATLEHLRDSTPLSSANFETFVVDNASTDGSADAVARRHPEVKLIRLGRNEGMAARNHAIVRAAGEYVTILDDDSYPVDDALIRAMRYMDIRPQTAGVCGRVVLPSGKLEASALPSVMIGCGTVLRRTTLEQVGHFAPEFFRQAEEYDLTFRLARAGYRIERFEDIVFRHDKHPGGRSSALTLRMDLRNNLILTSRYLPAELRRMYAADWTQRYAALAAHAKMSRVAKSAKREARLWEWRTAFAGRRVLDDMALESMLELEAQATLVDAFTRLHHLRDVVIADLGKNIHATWQACQRSGLRVKAIAENHPAFSSLTYRGVAVRTDAVAMSTDPEAIIVSNINPAQVERRVDALREQYKVPVLALWKPRTLSAPARDTKPQETMRDAAA